MQPHAAVRREGRGRFLAAALFAGMSLLGVNAVALSTARAQSQAVALDEAAMDSLTAGGFFDLQLQWARVFALAGATPGQVAASSSSSFSSSSERDAPVFSFDRVDLPLDSGDGRNDGGGVVIADAQSRAIAFGPAPVVWTSVHTEANGVNGVVRRIERTSDGVRFSFSQSTVIINTPHAWSDDLCCD